MAINNVNNGIPKAPVDNARTNAQQTQQQTNAQQTQQSAVANAPRQDSVSLTQSAQQLNQVQRRGTEAPVNQERVDRLKKAIQNGEYQVNPESLARKIARLEAEVFGTK